eukprot:702001-Pleurochrysis_carterae.AAC.1
MPAPYRPTASRPLNPQAATLPHLAHTLPSPFHTPLPPMQLMTSPPSQIARGRRTQVVRRVGVVLVERGKHRRVEDEGVVVGQEGPLGQRLGRRRQHRLRVRAEEGVAHRAHNAHRAPVAPREDPLGLRRFECMRDARRAQHGALDRRHGRHSRRLDEEDHATHALQPRGAEHPAACLQEALARHHAHHHLAHRQPPDALALAIAIPLIRRRSATPFARACHAHPRPASRWWV